MKYPAVVNKSEYGYDVHCPALPGCHSQGETLEEALKNIKDAISTYMKLGEAEILDAEGEKGITHYEMIKRLRELVNEKELLSM